MPRGDAREGPLRADAALTPPSRRRPQHFVENHSVPAMGTCMLATAGADHVTIRGYAGANILGQELPMSRDNGPRVVRLDTAREARRARPLDPTVLTHIITTQGELGRAGLDSSKVVDVVTRRAQELTRSSGAVVELVDGDSMYYWSASGAAANQKGLCIPIEGSLSGSSVRARRTLRCDDSETDPRVNREACRRVGLRSAIVMPLFCEEQLVGVLKVISPFPDAYTDDDVATLDLLGGFIGAALHHAFEYEQLRAKTHAADDALQRQQRERAAQRERIDAILAAPEQVQAVYQPIVDLASGREVGIEALSRFPSHYGRRPDQWFADATEVGFAVELELLCARRALAVLPVLPREMYLSLNLSPGTLASPRLDELITPQLAPRLVLEITETTEVIDYDSLVARVGALRAHGARLAIDDAGAGFASLRHVLRLEPDLIKLDVSLTRDIDTSRPRQTLASAMLMFARDTAASLVAEGIETPAELDMLHRLGVQYGQGFLFGRPAPRGE